MAEAVFRDELENGLLANSEEKIKERIEKLNEKLFNRSRLDLYDIYEEINKDLPEGMKIGRFSICNDLHLDFDYSQSKEDSDYKPIYLEHETEKGNMPCIRLYFDTKSIGLK
jgi:hypothetical protein